MGRIIPEGTRFVVHEVDMSQFAEGKEAEKVLHDLDICKPNPYGRCMEFSREDFGVAPVLPHDVFKNEPSKPANAIKAAKHAERAKAKAAKPPPEVAAQTAIKNMDTMIEDVNDKPKR